ncbi:MAG TPA: sirohydrochlorin nickelochelatase [Methanocorpusculum sp.]|nr:sirohydrochlorin nickelochelatase [Methanocorpusculum sp.]
MSKHGLLLIGHGSKLQHNKELATSTAELMGKKTDEYLIRSCFMESSSPTVIEGIDQMKKEDIDLLVIVPLFLAKGVHVLHDIPELLGLKTKEYRGNFVLANGKNIPLVYADPIGKDPMLADLMLKNAQNAISAHL